MTPQAGFAFDPVPIPGLTQWETNMSVYGKQHCTYLGNATAEFTDLLAATDYDAERVYYQINTYTSDPSWKYCAQLAEGVYRDQYVAPKSGKIPGDRLFTFGLRVDYERQADTQSKDAVILLSQNGVYTRGTLPDSLTQSYGVSREVAYALMAYIDAEQLGEPRAPKFSTYVTQALDHLDQWFVQRLWEVDDTFSYRPAMVGLTMQALIRVHSLSPDSRIPPKIKEALDGLWTTAWRPNEQAFYANNQTSADVGDPNISLLIAPAFAWYYLETGDVLYRDRGDAVFAGGVNGASLGEPTVFNQNYMWSVDYVVWRQAGDAKYATPPASSTPTPTPPADPPNLSKCLKHKVERLLHRAERLVNKATRLEDRAQEVADRRPKKADRLEQRAEHLKDKAEVLKGWAQSIVDGTWNGLKNLWKPKP